MQQGVMPRLAALVQGGGSGDLRSVMPFETSPAWSSFQTGCLPGKTRVFAFHTYDRANRTVRLNSFSDIAVPSIWELADKAGKTVVSLNMPVSSPPPRLRGVIVPGLLCPKLSCETVQPPEAYNRYIKPRRGYLIVNHDWQDTVGQFVDQAIATERVRCDVALDMMQDIDWDIFCVQVQSSDALQHKIWWAIDPISAGASAEEHTDAMRFYRSCDENIGRLVDAAGPETLKLLVSDHGFCAKKADVGVNTWLRQKGYLQLVGRPPAVGFAAAKNRLKDNHPVLKSMAKTYGSLRGGVSGGCKRIREKMQKPGSTRMYADTLTAHIRTVVDFETSRAFCLGGMAGMIYINGDRCERALFGQQLAGELLEAFGPQAKDPVITGIRAGREVYSLEEQQDYLPDLVVEFAAGYESRIHPGGEEVIMPGAFKGKQQGTHSRSGIFVAHGPAIRPAGKFDAEIVDIVPTILAYLDIPVPRYMDGQVMESLFSEPLHVLFKDVSYGASSATEYSDDEQRQVEKHLSDLGYL